MRIFAILGLIFVMVAVALAQVSTDHEVLLRDEERLTLAWTAWRWT